MFKRLFFLSFLAASLVPGAGLAGERVVTLAVENMTCALCPITVRRAIDSVPGVTAVEVDIGTGSATVTFDDTKSNVAELTEASANAGYPARLAE